MTRLRGWAPRGQRLVDKVPQGKWKTATFLAALRNDRIDAPCLFDGPINGERFHAYVEQFLAPTLKAGDVVILDNLGSHKGKAARKAIRDVGARLVFLPKYSPDLNPIEQVFAKFKGFFERLHPERSTPFLTPSPKPSGAIKPAECKNSLAGAGYSSPLPDTPHRSGEIDAVRLAYSRRVVAAQNSGMADSGGSISVQLSGPLKEYVGSAIASLVG